MMDLATIREFSKEAGRAARKRGAEPLVFTAEELDKAKGGDLSKLRHLPNLGSYLPKGWKRVSLKAEEGDHGVYMGDNDGKGAYFVDKGFGGGGPAISVEELARRMKPGLGYGFVEEGQFQIKVGAFAVRTA